jgi:hypothetical protein
MVTFAMFGPSCGVANAQEPTGTIAGMVRDPAGSATVGAAIKATNRATGIARTTTTSELGAYSFPALSSGDYQMIVEAAGVQQVVRSIIVEIGATTTADFVLRFGDLQEWTAHCLRSNMILTRSEARSPAVKLTTCR